MSKVVVVGLGYVGLPLAVAAAEAGHKVLGVDLDESKISSLEAGTSYVEDVTDERLAAVLGSGRLRCAGWVDSTFDVAVIAVPTPLRDGDPDLSYVKSAGRMLGGALAKGAAVVLESTTYPGTTEGLLANTLEDESGLEPGRDFHLGFSPERIDPGNKTYTLKNTPKLVSATTEEGLAVIRGFYDTVVDTTVPVSSPRVAEFTKIFENLQANVNIALINETADICRDLGVDVHEMVAASMTKGHSMAAWYPGPGVGGHCLPVDPMYLAWQARAQLGRRFRFAELADSVNNGRPYQVVERAVAVLNDMELPVNGTEVLVLGLAYKPDVGDLRESPALPIVDMLMGRGARVTVCDPHVTGWDKTPMLDVGTLTGAIGQFPLVVLVTHHAAFDYNKIAVEARMVLDCRNMVRSGSNVVKL